MTILTLRMIKGGFVVTGPDIEPVKFKSRREARNGCAKQHLGSPRDLSQAHLKLDGAIFSVIGVLPAGFDFPAGVDLWLRG